MSYIPNAILDTQCQISDVRCMLYNRYDPGYQGRRGWVFWSWRGNMEMINTIIDDRVKNICVGKKSAIKRWERGVVTWRAMSSASWTDFAFSQLNQHQHNQTCQIQAELTSSLFRFHQLLFANCMRWIRNPAIELSRIVEQLLKVFLKYLILPCDGLLEKNNVLASL